MNTLKVLHIFPVLDIGGTEKVILNISSYLIDELKCEVAICTTTGRRKDLFESKGVNIYNIPKFTNKLYIMSNLREIYKCIKSFRPDIIHTHSLYSLILVYILKKQTKFSYPIVHTGHGGPNRNYDKLAAKFCSLPNRYIALTEQSRSYLENASKHSNVVLIGNGVEEPPDDEVCFIPEGNSSRLELAFIGRLTQQKGVPILIQSIEQLVTKGIDVNLQIIGDGELRDTLEKTVISKNLEKNIFFRGFQKDPWKVVSKIPIIVMPSLWEQGALVAMEAIVRNHTLIASNILGVNHVIEPNQNGYMFNAENVEQLVNILLDIYSSKLPLISLNKEERTKYLFTKSTAPKLLNLYRELID
ncbi:glycosyltransferase [Paenibacillus sp. LjRoot153]|uniref:glycosyltransferase n=1 Tax=Paenibacillus sp. LjRoot153 TaxID=3342270 RepID=UPI003ECF9B34